MKRYLPLGNGHYVTSPFGPRSGGFHAGVDFGFPGGSGHRPVYCIQSGKVLHAGAAQGYGGPDPAGWLVVVSDDGSTWEYGHIIRRCNKGDRVEAGQIIAEINPDSRTNGGTAPHLHLSFMPNGYNPAAKADPMPHLKGAVQPTTEPPNPDRAPVVLPQIRPEGETVGFQGDPVWLEDVLRPALGDRLVVHSGWRERGTGGQMGDIWGVMIHHTGNRNERVEVIRDGVQQPGGFLRGPLSQALITPDGKFHLVAVGPCNHAGSGSYPGLGANNGNHRLIGFECAWPTIRQDGSFDERERWPDAQIITMRDATAAVLKRLGYGSDRVIGHKEYAGASQGKWDPGNIHMPWFRGEVAKDLRGEFDKPVSPPPVLPPVVPVLKPPRLPHGNERDLLEDILRQLRGPELRGWPQLEDKTLVDKLAEVDEKLDKVLALLEKDA